MTTARTLTSSARTAPHAHLPSRRVRRAVAHCDIWDLVAFGEPCPACENSYEDRRARATRTR